MNRLIILFLGAFVFSNFSLNAQLVYSKYDFSSADFLLVTNQYGNLPNYCIPSNQSFTAGNQLSLGYQTCVGNQIYGAIDTTIDIHPTVCNANKLAITGVVSYDSTQLCTGINWNLFVSYVIRQGTTNFLFGGRTLTPIELNLGFIPFNTSISKSILLTNGIDITDSEPIYIGVAIANTNSVNCNTQMIASFDSLNVTWSDELILNGGFEDTQYPCQVFANPNSPLNTVNGWLPIDENGSGCSLNIAGSNCGLGVTDGLRAIDLQPHSNNQGTPVCDNNFSVGMGIQQSIPTEIGSTYQLTFKASSNNGGGATDIEIFLNGTSFQNVNIIGNGFNTFSFSFNANSTTTSIRFVNRQNSVAVTALDEISIKKTSNDLSVDTSTICADEVKILDNNTHQGNWSLISGGGTLVQNEYKPSSPDQSNTVVIGYSENNCYSEYSFIVNPLPIVDIQTDTLVCQGDQIQLTALGAGINGTYLWNNGSTNNIRIEPALSTSIFSVVGIDENGCRDFDSTTVNVEPLPIVNFDFLQSGFCDSAMVLFQNLSLSEGESYSWSLSDGTTLNNINNFSHIFKVPGTYSVTLTKTTTNGCVNSLTMADIITVYPNPIANFSGLPSIISNITGEIDFVNLSSNANNYFWDFGDEQISTEENPNHFFNLNGSGEIEITLIAQALSGCVDTTTQSVQYMEELLFYVPNTFTPDGNEFNNEFKPIAGSNLKTSNYKMMIFNRWGEIIFESNDINYGWLGTYGNNSLQCEDGTYTWKIDFETSNSNTKKQLVGHVNLFR